MATCICGNYVHINYGSKQQFSLDLCHSCMAASNSPSYWNSKSYEHQDVTGDEGLYNKEQADN